MKKLILFLLLLLVPAVGNAMGCNAEGKCVEDFKKQGWQEVGYCFDGHEWSHVLEKGGARLRCTGINAFDGPTDDACMPFTGSLEKFKALAAAAKQQVDDYENAKKQGRLETYLRQQGVNGGPKVSCQGGGGS
ncbi:MAG TPA: hypothetical protein VHB73_00705 [Alphaproteobacteria bacterium]|nr:hypothetical protein [Alphaproteobacteria bacterium]